MARRAGARPAGPGGPRPASPGLGRAARRRCPRWRVAVRSQRSTSSSQATPDADAALTGRRLRRRRPPRCSRRPPRTRWRPSWPSRPTWARRNGSTRVAPGSASTATSPSTCRTTPSPPSEARPRAQRSATSTRPRRGCTGRAGGRPIVGTPRMTAPAGLAEVTAQIASIQAQIARCPRRSRPRPTRVGDELRLGAAAHRPPHPPAPQRCPRTRCPARPRHRRALPPATSSTGRPARPVPTS